MADRDDISEAPSFLPLEPYLLRRQRFGSIELLEHIGRGGMGEVWKGYDSELDLPVAVKILSASLARIGPTVQQFITEARALARINNANVIRVFQAGSHQLAGHWLRLIVMEYLGGRSLAEVMKAQDQVPLQQRLDWCLQAAKALSAVHAENLVHRDVKPSNLVLDEDETIVKLVDFGIAAHVSQPRDPRDLPETLAPAKGTHRDMAPELLANSEVDWRADIHGLGITLLELTLWRQIDEGGIDVATAEQKLDGIVSPEMQQLITEMLANDPLARPEVSRVIETIANELGAGDARAEVLSNARTRTQLFRRKRTNIAVSSSSFLGRAADLKALGDLFNDERKLVSLVGPAGIGKTRLAREFAYAEGGRFPGGSWFCDLSEARAEAEWFRAIARGLGIQIVKNDAPEQLASALSHRQPSLIVLDNLEQIRECAQRSLKDWLQKIPELHWLVTSREPLGLDAERVQLLEPILHNDYRDAVQLFIDRAKTARSTFATTDKLVDDVRQLVIRLDAMPLPIELAAAQIDVLSPNKILERLPKRLDVLKSRRGHQSDRQATLRAAIDWSWNLLKPFEQRALAQCALFANGFFLEAAEAVLKLGGGENVPYPMDVVESLVKKSLLASIPEEEVGGEPRFRMYESIRAYALERLATFDTPTFEALSYRHAEHYLEYLREWNPLLQSGAAGEALDRIELELENVMLAVHRMLDLDDSGASVLAAEIVDELAETLYIRGPWSLREVLLTKAINVLPASQQTLRASLLCFLVQALADIGKRKDAVSTCEKLIALVNTFDLDDDEQRAITLRARRFNGNLLNDGGKPRESIEVFRAAEKVAADYGDNRTMAMLAASRGVAHKNLGDLAEAETAMIVATEVSRAEGNFPSLCSHLSNLAGVYIALMRYDEALDCIEESYELSKSLNMRSLLANNVNNRGVVHTRRAEFREALEYFLQAAELYGELGNRIGLALTEGNRGGILERLGHYDDAIEHLDHAMTTARELSAQRPLGFWLIDKARALLIGRADTEAAVACAEESLNICRSMNAMKLEQAVNALAVLARCEFLRGNDRRAHELAEEARGSAEEIGIDLSPNNELEYGRWVEEILKAPPVSS